MLMSPLSTIKLQPQSLSTLCATPWSCGRHGFVSKSFFSCSVASKTQPVSSFSLQVTEFDSEVVLHVQAFKQLCSCTGKHAGIL